MSSWITHVKAYAKKNKVSYKQAMSAAKSSYKGKSAGAKTATKMKSKVPAKKRGRPAKAKMETAELGGKEVKFKGGALHAALKTPKGHTFKRATLNKIQKVAVGDEFEFLGKKRKMTTKLKKQVTLGLNLMKK
jgi:hypothetical protein